MHYFGDGFGLVVRIPGFIVLAQVQAPVSGWGTEIPQAMQCGQKKNKKKSLWVMMPVANPWKIQTIVTDIGASDDQNA